MKFIASGLAAATLASAASADITITLNNQSFAGFSFNTIMNYAGGQNALGTLTGAVVNMTLNASTAYTYADDICIYVGPSPIATGGKLQIGGFSNLGTPPGTRYFWPSGGSPAPGTTATGSVTLATPLTFVGDKEVDGYIYIGNGYGAPGTSGTWTGTITLIGIIEVPAPGAVALLGLAGLTARRRRR